MSTEVEFGGVKFTGGKMFVLLTALSTLGGAAWGGFQVYADYMDMKEIIQNIDIDSISAANELQLQKLNDAIDYTRDIKNDLRGDILRVEGVTEDTSRRMKDLQVEVDNRVRAMEVLNRDSEKDVRDTMRDVETRIEDKMRTLDTDLRKTLQEALDNPLAKK
jgi:gas vesicle protein